MSGNMWRQAVMRRSPTEVILGRWLRETIRRPHSLRPARFRGARTIVSRSQILPRAVFTRQAPRFIFKRRLPLKRFSVSGWSGALIVTRSQTLTICSTLGCQARPRCRRTSIGGVRQRRCGRPHPRLRACPRHRRTARRGRRCSSRLHHHW
jgi:hypothetical protein